MKTKLFLMSLCVFSLMFSLRAATNTMGFVAVSGYPGCAVHTVTDPVTKSINKTGSKKLSLYQKLLIRVIEKKLSKRMLYEGKKTSGSGKVLSIVSVITAFLGLIGIVTGFAAIGIVLSLVGLITGIIALSGNNTKEHKTMATWGTVVSGVTIGLAIVLIALFAAIFNDL